MNAGLIQLSPLDLLVASGFVVVAAGISMGLKLGIERRLGIAALRTVVQLGLLGLVLEKVFAVRRPVVVLAMLAAMIFFSGREAVARSTRRYTGIGLDAWLTMTVSCLLVGGAVTQVVVGVRPWFDPQYVIPILGMILGNSLNGVSLSLERLLETLDARRHEVELLLAFGAARAEALRDPMRAAVRTGMIPITNAMTVAGLVSLPGMMTGQILAGAPPLQAVAYQIVVMFMLAASNAFGAILIAYGASRRLVAPDGSLRLERLRTVEDRGRGGRKR
ncbi:MAG: iron export ABC transporter permease subunit FetB [Acidobacteria bacterium]|nr:iron export ABC transporter permease subunit FetB [Acidobacteriota bacterium]